MSATNLTSARATTTTAPRGSARPARPAETGRSSECLQLLARAIQQFHTYPATSPLCLNAVDACHRALSLLDRDHLDFRVGPHEVIVDEMPTGRGTLVETELARRLHAAEIAQVNIERAASTRELTRFCLDLLTSSERGRDHAGLIELLDEHGVSRIMLRAAYRPEVLPVSAPRPAIATLLDAQRVRREDQLARGGAVNHLYPPDKGWIRLDPRSSVPSVSLVDLALLIDDPASLATMLLRLTDGDVTGVCTPEEALAQKFSDVTTLFAALDPKVARVMFSRLAQAVLELDPSRRQALLRRTILPGLLDGKVEGTVLRDFPDLDLADSLCLLLDLETAAPEVVTSALARLDLPAERQQAVMPLLRDRLETRGHAHRETGLDAHARRLVNVEAARAKSFAEFAAFDLALDGSARDALVRVRDGIAASDLASDQLACLWNLVRLEANPEVAQRFMDRAMPQIERLEQEGRWPFFAFWVSRLGALAADLREGRPDVAEVISARLTSFCTADRAQRLAHLAARDTEGRAMAEAVLLALGPPMGGALASACGRGDGKDPRSRAALQLLCDHAALVGPAIVEVLSTADTVTARGLVRVLGMAGAGYEAAIAGQIGRRDEQIVRECLRSLARIATPRAAALVRAAIEQADGWVASAAAETLWHFPPPEARRQVLDLLARREFVLRQPDVASRLLERAAQGGGEGLEPVLSTLTSLRYRVWSPSLVRVGRRARVLLQQ